MGSERGPGYKYCEKTNQLKYMQDLLNYIVKMVLGKEKFSIEEAEDNGRTIYTIKTDPKNIGLVIGKGGHVIKSLRNILKVRATLEKKAVSLNVGE